LPTLSRWVVLVRYIVERIIAVKPKNTALIALHSTQIACETG